MAKFGWHVREVIICGKEYSLGNTYNTPKGLLVLNKIDTIKGELVFMDKDNNFVNIDFFQFI